jgi:hypothetical protein
MMVVRKMAYFTDTGKVLSPFIRKMAEFTDENKKQVAK